MTGFKTEVAEKLEAAGWIKGTDCGYKDHTGYVHGTQGGGITTYSLTHANGGLFNLQVIRNGICERASLKTLADVLAYFG